MYVVFEWVHRGVFVACVTILTWCNLVPTLRSITLHHHRCFRHLITVRYELLQRCRLIMMSLFDAIVCIKHSLTVMCRYPYHVSPTFRDSKQVLRIRENLSRNQLWLRRNNMLKPTSYCTILIIASIVGSSVSLWYQIWFWCSCKETC